MNKQVITNTLKSLQKTMRKHSPAILTGIGIAGMVATTVMAVRATPKALRMVDDKEIEDGKRLTTSEIIKTTWKCYIPAAVTGVCSAACIIGASSISARRNAALVTAYTISETALKEYKDKAVEVVGPKKEQAIRDAVAKEQLEKANVTERKFVATGRGETPCFDPLTNTCFKSDIETLRKAENVLNKRMRDEVKVTVNEFLEEIGLDPCDESIGENLGWDIDKGWVDLDFSSQLVDGVPYLVVGHHNPPRYIGWGYPINLVTGKKMARNYRGQKKYPKGHTSHLFVY